PGPADGIPSVFTLVGDTVFFTADDGVNGVELWKTDGTPAGTVMVKDLNPGGNAFPFELTALGNVLIFGCDGPAGQEIWRSDGTNAGTFMLRDIRPGSIGSDPRYLTAWRNLVLFICDDGVVGDELWKTDGTTAGTVRVRDINPGATGSGAYGLY